MRQCGQKSVPHGAARLVSPCWLSTKLKGELALQVPAAPLANTARGGLSLGIIWEMLSGISGDCSGQDQELDFDDPCRFLPTQGILWFYDHDQQQARRRNWLKGKKIKNDKEERGEIFWVFFLRNTFLATAIPLQTTDSIAPSATSANLSEHKIQEWIG